MRVQAPTRPDKQLLQPPILHLEIEYFPLGYLATEEASTVK